MEWGKLVEAILDRIKLDEVFGYARKRKARDRIRELADLIHLEAMDYFVPGVARARADWQTETKSGLRAIVKDEIYKNYEDILLRPDAKVPAKRFLETLADTLALSHLRT